MTTAAELIDSVKHRLESRENIYPAINKAIRILAKRLMYHNSDLVTGSLNQAVLAAADSATLPTDFWGLRGFPYISGDTAYLKPLPSKSLIPIYQNDAVPIYYEIHGQTMKLIPGTASAITILGDYWQRPTKITAPLDTVPYFEQFDDAIGEYIVEAVKTKPKQESEIQLIIIRAVDEIVPIRDMRGNTPFPSGEDWDFLANG